LNELFLNGFGRKNELGNELTLGPMVHVTFIHESMKEGFVCLSHWFSQIMPHLAAHLVSLESP
jgi:hypothetical protein